MMPVVAAMASLDQKSHVAFHFNCLDLTNALLPLMTPFASCYASVSVTGVTWPKHHVAPHFDLLVMMNAMVLLIIPLASQC